MAEYKQPKTRIRVVEDGNGVRYYPQYLVVIIPFILWEWQPIYEELANPEYLPTLDEAKGRIDRFLTRHKNYWLSDTEKKARMKDKKKVSIIDYPQGEDRMKYGSLKCPHCGVWSDKWKSVKYDTPKEMFDIYTCNCGGESVWFAGAPVLIRADEVDASVEWRVGE